MKWFKWFNWLNRREAIMQKFRSWNVAMLWESLYYDSGNTLTQNGCTENKP